MLKKPVKIPYSGTTLLEMSLLNKGTAFSEEERDELRLHGLLPQTVETIEEQASRIHFQYQMLKSEIDKHIFLRNLQDTNETLFYHILREHLEMMLPVIYTPTVGEACQRFSEIYRASKGIFVSYPNRHRIDELLANVTKRNVKVIVVTDGERILGLGDQGIGGMGISIGKLSLYSACGGISPAYTLPMVLDAGTNNQLLLGNPMYMGWKNPRISGEEYDEFVEAFIKAVQKRWPKCLLQFEDFAHRNAAPLLNRYRERLCCFNDDIQGTAAVTLASVLSAVRSLKQDLRDQRFVFFGAGSAGSGIAHQIAPQGYVMYQDLKIPSLLIALPAINDPHFVKSVVLLIQHNKDGALGYVINRPLPPSLRDAAFEARYKIPPPYSGMDGRSFVGSSGRRDSQ